MIKLSLINEDTLPSVAGPKRLASVAEAVSWPKGPDVDHKIPTLLFRKGGYVVQLSKPGKEADRVNGNNPNDMRPEVLIDGKLIEKNATFREVFEELQKVHLLSVPGIRLMACLLARSAYMADHKETSPGVWRYDPPVEAVERLESLIPQIYGVPTGVFMHYLDALALNEDTKYSTLGYDIKAGYGRKNNLLTCVNLIGVLLGEVSIATFAGSFSQRPAGISAISKKKMWEIFPELSE